MHEVRDVHHVGKRLADAGIFELLEQRAGETHVQPRHVPVLIEHPGDAVVAPENLLGLPALAGIVQRHQIAGRLVHVQSEGMEDFRHGMVERRSPTRRESAAFAKHAESGDRRSARMCNARPHPGPLPLGEGIANGVFDDL